MKMMAEFDSFLRDFLSTSRYEHCKSVQYQCEELAKIYNVDYTLARSVGLLHDFARELPSDLTFEKARKYRLSHGSIYYSKGWISKGQCFTSWEKISPVFLHGVAGCQLFLEKWGSIGIFSPTAEKQFLEAIEHHSLGFLGWSPLTQLLYVADFIEPTRAFDNFEFRNLVGKISLNKLAVAIVKHACAYDQKKGRATMPPSLEILENEKIR